MGGVGGEVEQGTGGESSPPSPPGSSRQGLFALMAVGLSLAFLATGIGRSGVWDPHELDRADLARRIAIHLFGARQLELGGALNTMPTLSDLGSGELPFTSMAWGLATFGLHDWAGRLPLALWAVAGAVTLHLFLARLVSERAGLYALIALVTMPLYFVQSRTMLGDAVTMAAFTMAFCGLGGALLEDRSLAVFVGWLLLGLFGSAAGFLSRGALIGVAAPLLGVGGTWLVLWGSGRRSLAFGRIAGHLPGWARPAIGIACLSVGVAAAYLGAAPLVQSGWKPPEVARLVGVALQTKPAVESTFDLVVRDLGHALFPWSALIPFAAGRLMWSPRGLGQSEAARDTAVRVALLVGSAAAYGVFAWLAPYVGTLAFAAPALLAAIVGVVIHDYERGGASSVAFGVAVLLACVVLLKDMTAIPLKTLAAYGVAEAELPKGFAPVDSSLLGAAAACFAAFALLTWLDPPGLLGDDSDASGPRLWLRRRIEVYERVARQLVQIWSGNLLFAFLVVEAALVGLGAMLLVGRRLDWASVTRMPQMFAYFGLNAWWVLPLGAVAVPLLVDAARFAFALAVRSARLPRGSAMALGGLLTGAMMAFGFYPAVAAQLSPKEVFDVYASLHGPGEPLGVLGLSARVGRFYAAGEDSRALASARAAGRWLVGGRSVDPPQRRWLAFRERDLGELNSLYRAESAQNLPVIDAQSGNILLASNQLAGARNENPLDAVVLAAPPEHIQHPLAVTFGSELEGLGWEVEDEGGRLVEHVVPGRHYSLRFYYRVLKSVRRAYKAFLHIDGYGRRHNGDHDVLDGKYAMTRWLAGDVIVDRYDLILEPNFSPGSYALFYGFFIGGERFEVTRGDHHEGRVRGGVIVVR